MIREFYDEDYEANYQPSAYKSRQLRMLNAINSNTSLIASSFGFVVLLIILTLHCCLLFLRTFSRSDSPLLIQRKRLQLKGTRIGIIAAMEQELVLLIRQWKIRLKSCSWQYLLYRTFWENTTSFWYNQVLVGCIGHVMAVLADHFGADASSTLVLRSSSTWT